MGTYHRVLVDAAVIIFSAVAGVAAAAFAVGRWWALALPFVVVPLVYLGLGRGWWGAGLGDGWGFAMVGVLALAVGAASVAVAVRTLARRHH
jgi:hypothetical protein